MGDNAACDAAALAIFRAVANGEMKFVACLRGNALRVLPDVAIDDGLQHIEGSHGHTFDRDGIIRRAEARFGRVRPRLRVRARAMKASR